MAAGSLVITVHQPRGERWRELAHEWYVETAGETLSMPTASLVIRLKPEVTADQASDIADDVRSRLDGGNVTIEYRRYEG